MTTIQRSDVPLYLRGGSFFESLDPNDEEVFTVPDRCFKIDTQVGSVDDLERLLSSIRFWGVSVIPVELFKFVLTSANVTPVEELGPEYPQFDSYLRSCIEVRDTTTVLSIALAIKHKLGVMAVQILHQRGDILTAAATEAAACVGDLDSLQFLHSVSCPWDERVITAFLSNGGLSGLTFALENGCPLPNKLMNKAALTGNVDVLKYLQNRGIPWEEDTLSEAIRSKNVECVRYLHGAGCAIRTHDCASAARWGSVECLAYVHQNGGTLDNVVLNASLSGNLPCIQYVYAQQGFTAHDALSCGFMAHGGHFECLRFAHENGCPWDEYTLKNAFLYRQWSCFWYALTHGCPCMDGVWTLVDLLSCVLALYTACKNFSENKLFSIVQVYFSLQRFINNLVTRSYLVVGGPNRDAWNALLTCFNYLSIPAGLCVVYAAVGYTKAWFYK